MAKKIINKTDLPYNLEAEKAVLGSALISEDALYNVVSSLLESDFYDFKHQKVYRAIMQALDNKKKVDVLTVAGELDNMKELENIGGVDYLYELTDSMISLGNLKSYVDIVLDQAILRQMLVTIRGIDKKYREEEIESTNDFILESEVEFKEAIERRNIDRFVTIRESVDVVKRNLDALKENPAHSNLTGLDTGYEKLNELTQGFQKGEVYIVAARPNVGKTALALNFAYNVASKERVPVAIFSLEMGSDLLTQRLLGIASNVSLTKIKTGTFDGQERVKIAQGLKDLSELPIYIDETPGIKLMDIIAKTKKLISTNPNLGLIIVDYLGLVQIGGSNKNTDSRQEEVRKISLEIKALARETKVPVILISQLSRASEKRDSKRPMLSDLRDSGSIEQDADAVILLYREDYYKNQTADLGDKKGNNLTAEERFEAVKAMKIKEMGDTFGNVSLVEVNLAKNRNGSTGRCDLFFYKSYGRYSPPDKGWELEMERLRQDAADNK